MFDSRLAGHPSEELPRSRLLKHVLGEINEGRMHVMRRDQRGDAIDEACCQNLQFSCRSIR